MEGALGQRDKQKPMKGRQQTKLGSKPGMGDGCVSVFKKGDLDMFRS